jgi:hypothetical protein
MLTRVKRRIAIGQTESRCEGRERICVRRIRIGRADQILVVAIDQLDPGIKQIENIGEDLRMCSVGQIERLRYSQIHGVGMRLSEAVAADDVHTLAREPAGELLAAEVLGLGQVEIARDHV